MSEVNNEEYQDESVFAQAVKEAIEKAEKDKENEEKVVNNANEDSKTKEDEDFDSKLEEDDDSKEANSNQENEESTEEKKKGPSFLKKKDKKEKSDKKDEKIAELNDRLLRNMAEFENFRKRSDKEKSQMFEMGAKSIIEKILPVIDNFERGFDSLSETDKENPFVQGMEKIYKQMLDTLAQAGVTPIEALGKEFDPNLHNAIMHEDNEEFGENIVSQEFQKGYMYHEQVVRFSMVKVAN